MPGALQGKVAVVTGGGSGIGRATSLLLAREGARVMIADIDTKGGEETVKMVKRVGGEASFVKADVTVEAQVKTMAERTIATYGSLDCAFNNAGIGEKGSPMTTDYSLEEWNRVIGVNLTGVWMCMKHEIPWMLRQGRGAIVNTASMYGLVGDPVPDTRYTAYVASKHGVIGLTKNSALEYAQKGIRINCVCPGYIRTPMIEPSLKQKPGHEQELSRREPVGRIGEAKEVAEAVVWLLSDAASFVTGHSMVIDGGYTAM